MRQAVIACFAAATLALSYAGSTPKCVPCNAPSSGPCQNSIGDCWPMDGAGHCPTGTSKCNCDSSLCTGGGSGPCIDGNHHCSSYYNSNTGTCSSTSHLCTLTPPPAPVAPATCIACVAGTSGKCQQPEDGVCWSYLDPVAKTCPTGAPECACPTCTGGTTGKPCHAADGKCYSYSNAATHLCPANTFECFVDPVVAAPAPAPAGPDCTGCAAGTSGPCKYNGVCYPYQTGTTCPTGSSPCGGSHLRM